MKPGMLALTQKYIFQKHFNSLDIEMRNKAKLFILVDKDWKPLAEEVSKTPSLINLITIFQLMTSISVGNHYAILSLSDTLDRIIQEFGGYESPENMLIYTLRNYFGDPLFGYKNNVLSL